MDQLNQSTTETPEEGVQETAGASSRHQHRLARQQLSQLVSRVAGAVCGCGIIILSVFNLSINVLEYREQWGMDLGGTPGWKAWGLAVPFSLVTCLVPLLAGFWLLFGSLGTLRKN